MALPISFRWDDAFVHRLDAARGDVPRSAFVRKAVEAALSGSKQMMERPPPKQEPSEAVGERQVPEHIATGQPTVKPTHPAYTNQLYEIEQARHGR